MSGAEVESDFAGRRLHFIAIGGAGMSGLALVCHQLGAEVSGSDRAASSYLDRVRAAGIEAHVGHDAANVPAEAEVVVSTAVPADNPELALARERGQRVLHRGELLAELCALKRLIAVAGTHGKTTITAMLAWALRGLGRDPAFFIGGELPRVAGSDAANAGWGKGEWAVAEADESDASFLRLGPEIAIVSNVEMDHHSRWGSLAELTGAFARFAKSADLTVLPDEGVPAEVAQAAEKARRFNIDGPGPADLSQGVPGAHNALNARAAIAALAAAGEDPNAAAAALADFPGVRRRLELKGTAAGARVYDDYAHHPTEVRAALSALRELAPDRLVAVFQPHLYSRTKAMAADFGAALARADEIVVLDVYPAREEPVGDLAGVSGLDVARAAADRAGGRRVLWAPALSDAEEALRHAGGDGSIVVTLGAGDVHRVGERLVEGAA